MTRLCKHFSHKILARIEGTTGISRLTAVKDDLQCVIKAAVEQLQDIIDRHLARLAFREGFTRMGWSQAA